MIHVIIVELVIGKPALKFIIDEFVKLPEAFHIDILFWIWKISAVFTSIPMYKVMPPFKSVRKLYRLEDRIYNRSIRRRSVGHRASSQRVIKPWDVDCKYFMMDEIKPIGEPPKVPEPVIISSICHLECIVANLSKNLVFVPVDISCNRSLKSLTTASITNV